MAFHSRLASTLRTLSLGMLVLAAAFSGVVSVPARAQSGSASAISTQQIQSAQKMDEDPNDVYRHSATVRWIAHSFHTSTESAARTFEGINFLILVLAIVIPLARILPGVLRRRSQALREQFDSTRAATEQAHAQLTALTAQLGDLGSEIAAMRQQVAAEMDADEARHRSAVQEETARILAEAGQEMESAAAQAQRELRSFAASLAIENAMAGLAVSAEQDRALLDDFVRDDFVRASGNGGKG